MNYRSRYLYALLAASSVLALSLLCLAKKKEFSLPKLKPAAAYPAHDYHPREKVTTGVDPYDTAEKEKIFIIPYRELEILPVLVVVTNDSDAPIVLKGMKVQLVTADGTKLSPETEDDVYRRVSHPNASTTRVPLPFPTGRVKGGVNTKEYDEISNAQFKAEAVEPLSSQGGFLFFDVSDVKDPLAGAHLYVTNVRDSSGNMLMYFDVPLDKAAQSR